METEIIIPIKRLDFFYNGLPCGYHFTAKIRINGVDASMLIDTGASSTVMDINSLSEFNNKQEPFKPIVGASSVTGKVESAVVALDEINLGGSVLNNHHISVIDMSHVWEMYSLRGIEEKLHGVLGADLLWIFKAVIDLRTGRLILTAPSK